MVIELAVAKVAASKKWIFYIVFVDGEDVKKWKTVRQRGY